MKRIVITLAAVLVLAVGALPTGAGNSTPTGVRLSLLGGPEDTGRAMLANTAFHVRHGFRNVNGDASPDEVQQSSVTLAILGRTSCGSAPKYVIVDDRNG